MNTQHKSTTHREKFFHYRPVELTDTFTGCTIFARKEEDGWYYSYALCAAVDNFNKSIGRNMARRRYFQSADCWNIGNDEPNGEILCKLAVSAILQNS